MGREDAILAAEQLLYRLRVHTGAGWKVGTALWRQTNSGLLDWFVRHFEYPHAICGPLRGLESRGHCAYSRGPLPRVPLPLHPHLTLQMGARGGARQIGNVLLHRWELCYFNFPFCK